jgi:serpin B
MVILLPQEQAGLPALERRLTLEKLEGWLSQLRSTRLRVQLPRFKLSERIQLNAVLSDLGMPSAFSPGRADFSAMNGKRDLYISAAVHQAFVEVNEEGTEAAAATGVVIGRTSVAPQPEVFRADHPFLFLIRDNRTGSILFLGRIVDPNA